MKSLYGATDKLIMAPANDEALSAAKQRARKRLPGVLQHFARGLAPNERLIVKSPFKTADGQVEYMWVEVRGWRGNAISGTLINEPYWVKGLQAGSPVTVTVEEVFDYIWTKPDGTEEGNETGPILERLEKAGK
jgi:uncharacterized protein YegJ (DUF2314 family)